MIVDRLLFWGLLAVVALAPLPFASVHSWSWATETSIVGALVLCKSAHIIIRPPSHSAGRVLAIPGLLFSIALLWALLQISPLVPQTWHHLLWQDSAQALGFPYRGSIALDPAKAWKNILRLLTNAGIFWLTFDLCRDASRAKLGVAVFSTSCFCYGIYGLVEWASGTETILWYAKDAYIGDLTGTFVNRNNFATYLGMGLVCFVGLLYQALTRALGDKGNIKERIRQIVLLFETNGWRLVGGVTLLAGALFLTHSRAGFAASVFGILTLCVCIAVGYKANRRMIGWFALVAAMAIVVFYIAVGAKLDQRLAMDAATSDERIEVYTLTLKAILDQPILGTGLGSFEEVFRFYRSAGITATFDYAHNTYLELALELGIPATAAMVLSLIHLFVLMLRGCHTRRRHSIYPCIGAAVTVLVGLHSLLDFSVQIPAVAYSYAFLLGLGCAQALRSENLSHVTTSIEVER